MSFVDSTAHAAPRTYETTRKRCHDGAKSYLERRVALGDTKTEALRALKRKLSGAVYRALLVDAASAMAAPDEEAA